MTRFRPCIDLHNGHVKQIVGGSLRDTGRGASTATENFVADQPSEWFARQFAQDGLLGGHVIKLGAGNEQAAGEALAAYPGGLQIGGGINLDNAATWLEAGASHVILTSWLFDEQGRFQDARLAALVERIGSEKIVLDLSCRQTSQGWTVAMNRWQTLTDVSVDEPTLDRLAGHCDEFLIHAADVEGLCQGIDERLVERLGAWRGAPMTYAGGVASWQDIELIERASGGALDVTVGTALDLFGGRAIRYRDLVEFNQRKPA